MGLFTRNTPQEKDDDLDEIELPSSTDLKADIFPEDEPKIGLPAAPSRRVQAKTGYGIEDAIHLMKDLPRDNNEVVVTVVKKTLESTHIQVQDIVDDAIAKEERIRQQHKSLEEEIKHLQEQIAQRNQQITDLLRDLKETADVRQRLQLAMELEAKKSPAAPPLKQAISESAAPRPATEAKPAITSAPATGGANGAATNSTNNSSGANGSTTNTTNGNGGNGNNAPRNRPAGARP